MSADPLSPIAPARIRALLLPVGRIKRSRFLTFVDLLQPFSIVRLGDVTPDPRPDRNMFSPLAFPSGTLLYDLSTSHPPASHLSLSPFEVFREPLLVIGIGDATEYAWLNQSRADDSTTNGESASPPPEDQDAYEIQTVIENLREQFPKAYLHSFMLFDSASQTRHRHLPPETILVPPKAQLKTTTLKTFMCDLTSTLLAELNTLAKSILALPTVPSPSSQNGVADNAPSWSNPDLTGTQFSRRNSQTPIASRPDSPISNAQKDLHRMSMPVLPSTTGLSMANDDSRATSPVTQGARTPPTTFDDIAGVNLGNTLQRTNSNSSKSGSGAKDQSDRVSIHGFGSGGAGERARNKGRGRISIVIGTLYMCAGQWHEAMKELIDGAVKARTFSDHLWHAKALENIMVCLLLFAWSGMDFQIPSVCSPTNEKLGSKSPQHTPSNSVVDFKTPGGTKSAGHEASLENLNSSIPDLVNMILNIYTRAANFAGESLPPLAFSECVIRFSKLLAAMNLSAGYLDDDSLHHLVQNTPLRQKPRLSVPRISVHPTRYDIATMLLRALPGPVETSGINATDRVVVLAGVAAVLSSLGLQRKKAIVMKEFISSLIPGLVQARKVGAAEMGVHPAAGLAALNMASGGASGAGALNLGEGEVENGINEFLGLLGRTYGVPDSRGTLLDTNLFNSTESGIEGLSTSKACQLAVEEILRVSSLRAFGSLNLKLDILRMCINFCEALPDFNGVIHFTALLLRLAGPGTAPKPNSTDVFVSLPREEQVRLYANISRTVAASNKLGLQHVETDYWDDFLVRGLFILEELVPLRLTQHRPAELKSTTSGKDGPFIHNPWVKKPQSTATETVLVANEEYRFVISLQNPYDFELEVDSLKIATEDVDFVAHEENFILGPYRTQKFPITGIPRSTGTLKIIGCYIKVAGCRERLFPIFPEPWKPERESKIKKIGLKACLGAPVSRPASAVATLSRASTSAPKPASLTFNVIQDQPVVVVTNVSLPQSSIMVLEGEKRQFSITLKNTSSTTVVDFVHISFQDSATSTLQAATSNRDLPGAELHELEVQLAHFPPLRWCRTDEAESIHIKPGEVATFDIEVVGRTRLTDAMIQIDYANIGKRRSEVQDRFFTRQVSIPIAITVNASVQLQRPDIIPLSGDFIWSNQQHCASSDAVLSSSASLYPSSVLCNKNDINFQSFLQHLHNQGNTDEYCMLLLDLRNSWPNPLAISMQVRPPTTEDREDEDLWKNAYAVSEVIQPGHVNRVVMILPKIYLKDPHAPIPSLNPANQRQFVVSASKISPEMERASREGFWYRDELLKIVRGTWTEEGSGRHGEIELRSIRLSARMAEAIRLEDVRIETRVISDYPTTEDDENIEQLGQSRFQVPVDEFLTLKTKVYNRSAQPISPLLRILPHLAGLPHNIALDLDKRFSWTGVLQRKLPIIQPGETVESDLGIVALSSGAFEIGVTVEELELIKPEKETKGARARSATETLMQPNLLAEAKLRAWHMKEPCIVVAKRIV